MTKEAAIEELKQWLKGETVLSWNASEKLAGQIHERIEKLAKQQAIAFGQFRDKFKLLEMARIDKIIQEKGMITYDRAKDEYIYHQFIEHQKQNNQ